MSELLDQAFPVLAGTHFFDDFPIWDPARKTDSSIIRVGVFEGQLLRSCAGVRIAQLKIPQGLLKIAIVGAVATHESARGQGLASETVSHAVKWAQIQNAALCLLWGSEHSLYAKLGFELCGQQVRVPLVEFATLAKPSEIRWGLDRALFEAIKKRPNGLHLENSDFRWFSAHKNVIWISSWANSRCMAYVAINRGIDLQNIVHEWGGEVSELKKLLGYVSAQAPNSEVLCAPSDATSFGAQATSDVEFLALAKFLDPVLVSRSFGMPGEKSDTELFSSPQKAFSTFPLWIWGLDAA